MKPTPYAITSFVLFSLATLWSPAGGAEPPKVLYLDKNRTLQKPEPPRTAPVHMKKDYLTRARQRVELARKTLDFVQQMAPRPEMAAELRSLDECIERAAEDQASSVGRDLFAQAVELRRRIIFSHPALDFDRLLLTKRPPPALSAPGDNYYGLNNDTGPGLVILDQWKTDRPRETALLEGKLPPGCAMHPDLYPRWHTCQDAA